MTVRRTLPNRQRSTIGAWCFVDHYGPDEVELSGGMNLGPHPHTGPHVSVAPRACADMRPPP